MDYVAFPKYLIFWFLFLNILKSEKEVKMKKIKKLKFPPYNLDLLVVLALIDSDAG